MTSCRTNLCVVTASDFLQILIMCPFYDPFLYYSTELTQMDKKSVVFNSKLT